MLRFARWLSLLLAACCLGLLWESRAAAELAGRRAIAARDAQSAAAEAERRAAAADAARMAAEAQAARLERDLDAALESARAVGEVLTQQVEARQRGDVARESTAALSSVPMPTGVLRCLGALRECLLADGFQGVRFLSAREVADGELRQVEVLDDAGDPSGSELIVAERAAFVLDRAQGALRVRFSGGSRRAAGLRAELPADGYEKRFAPVTGPLYETRLPYLVRATGSYPAAPVAAPEPVGIDADSKRAWLERFDALLARAGTEQRLRVADFRALVDNAFRTVQLVGYEKGKTLGFTAHCRQLAVEVDARAGVVSLLLRDGTLNGKGGESSIGADGYRMLLPELTPKIATEVMLGMVVQR